MWRTLITVSPREDERRQADRSNKETVPCFMGVWGLKLSGVSFCLNVFSSSGRGRSPQKHKGHDGLADAWLNRLTQNPSRKVDSWPVLGLSRSSPPDVSRPFSSNLRVLCVFLVKLFQTPMKIS